MIEAQRLSHLPPYLFVEIDRRKKQALLDGKDVIDFGLGDPDQPTPDFIVDRLGETILDPANHHYGSSAGSIEFRNSVSTYLRQRFNIDLDPQTEVAALIGTKEGIAHLPLSTINPSDVVLIPDPGYPVYTSGTVLAGGECFTMPLRETNSWLPVFSEIPKEIRQRAKLMFLNYPNNPTSACATLSFYAQAIEFAREHHILIAQDAAYEEVYFEEPPPSILQVEGAKDVCVEFHSLSKTFNMTGWRIGFVAGCAAVLAALTKVKNNIDSGAFPAIEQAATTAIQNIERPEVSHQRAIYRRRRDILIAGLRQAGWSVQPPEATFYVWAKCSSGYDSISVASKLLDEACVVVIPGVGFGTCGEGYIRFALTVDEHKTKVAVERIAGLSWKLS